MNHPHSVTVVGDTDTAQRRSLLQQTAAEQDIELTHGYFWDPNPQYDRAADLEPLVAAVRHAVENRQDVWLPFPNDLPRGSDRDVLAQSLRRRGQRLLVGPLLTAYVPGTSCPHSRVMARMWEEMLAFSDAVAAGVAISTLVDEIERLQGTGYSSSGYQQSEASTTGATAAHSSEMDTTDEEATAENDRPSDSAPSTTVRRWGPATRQWISSLLRAVAGRVAGGAA